ncbi:hypothetical protein TTHERM_00102660 (macronuclear) [Tetrahymena thermophila SB210]|uniref:Transmembrane protein n=1 Tax=Tetrahymena thermophila (strain SB210) TaxID=312017 RepID=Q234N2_TETTS|nr:hypothetical protein TTHERM_00102660 [Tetrahymena thermophila SB210]EAR91971.2 hypothetical protein TTHERM_00102660 [Tetrahymena thermophila SB210]|eukprot:XP_001012216.2 hypothetical protein TTHERM_00102660 [Tetrahymena thermophila SB210]
MKKIIALALLLSIVNCKLNGEFQTMMKIDSIGDALVQFDLNTQITYFTSIECQDCLYFGDQIATRFTCLKEQSCVQSGTFQDEQISYDYFASGDIIDVRMVLEGVHFYLRGVYLVKSLYTLNQNPSKYPYQRIGLLLASSFGEIYESQIFISLYSQGKINKKSYSLYYDQTNNNYHLTIPDYDPKLIPSRQSLFNLTQGWNGVFKYEKKYIFSGKLDFCDEQMLKQIILNIYLNPAVNDQVFQIDESYFQDFDRFLIEKRMEPDLSLFTIQQPGEWSQKNNFTFGVSINVDQSGILPKPLQLDLQFPQDDVMIKKDDYYTLNINFIKNLYSLTLGKRIFSRYLYYLYQDEHGQYKVALAPLLQKQSLRNSKQEY